MNSDTPDPLPPAVDIYAKANVANIVKKLKAGKTISSSDRKALDAWRAQEDGGGWVKNLTALARELGLTRPVIYDARAKYPDAPPKHADGVRENLIAWQDFCAEKLIGKDVATKTLADLKADMMRENIALLKKKNAREDGDVVAIEIVEDAFVTLGQKLDLLLRLKLEVELGQRVIGKSAAEVNVEGALILDEIREVVNANLATYRTEMTADSARAGEES